MTHPTRTLAKALGLLLLSACGGETGFSHSTSETPTETGSGTAEVYPGLSLTWTDLVVGEAQSELFKITNTGDKSLTIYKVDLTSNADGQFYVEEIEDELELPPQGDKEFAIVATLTTAAAIEGEARVKTSDAENLDIRIALSGTPASDDTGGDDTGGDDTGGDDTGT